MKPKDAPIGKGSAAIAKKKIQDRKKAPSRFVIWWRRFRNNLDAVLPY